MGVHRRVHGKRFPVGACAVTGSGVWVVDKPEHLTSADVLRRLKRKTGPVRMGHAGTLDPMATGVLLVCLGEATKLLNFMELEPKTYRGTLRFGVRTDTWDITGNVVDRRPVRRMATRHLARMLAAQEGERFLHPPVYSAIKHKGKPLYAYARQGKAVETAPRRTVIHAFLLLSNQGTDVVFELVCSRGTYVRAVVHALGEQMGCGACLLSLRRVGVGRFRIHEARSLQRLEALLADGRGSEVLWTPEALLRHLPACSVEGERAVRVRNGSLLRGEALVDGDVRAQRVGQQVRILENGLLIAVAEVRRDGQEAVFLKPLRVLNRA